MYFMKDVKINIDNLFVNFGYIRALNGLSLEIPSKKINCFIGPSGCGKTTLLKTINRLNELKPDFSFSGRVIIEGVDILNDDIDIVNLRQKAAMVFQKPALFPKSVFANVAFPLKVHGIKDKNEISEKVITALKRAFVWEEVKDRLNESALNFSIGQQQRIAIARALVSQPDILMLDEPTGSLDPVSTKKIEDLIFGLKRQMTILVVSHNLQQAASIGDYTVFLKGGELVEANQTVKFFTKPDNKISEDFLTGKMKN
jgi:phosphate transport system ATP-binding protein